MSKELMPLEVSELKVFCASCQYRGLVQLSENSACQKMRQGKLQKISTYMYYNY